MVDPARKLADFIRTIRRARQQTFTPRDAIGVFAKPIDASHDAAREGHRRNHSAEHPASGADERGHLHLLLRGLGERDPLHEQSIFNLLHAPEDAPERGRDLLTVRNDIGLHHIGLMAHQVPDERRLRVFIPQASHLAEVSRLLRIVSDEVRQPLQRPRPLAPNRL